MTSTSPRRFPWLGLLVFVAAFIIGASAVAYRVGQIAGQQERERIEIERRAFPAGHLFLGDEFPRLTVHDRNDQPIQVRDMIDGEHFVVINFHHPDCPCAENCAYLIGDMQEEGYDDVRIVGIMSSGTRDERNLANLDRQIEEGAVTFPVYMDHDRSAQNTLGATRTPEIWVLDKEGRVRYHGAPESTLFPGSEDHRYLLKEAIDALREGQEPEIRLMAPIGCPIT